MGRERRARSRHGGHGRHRFRLFRYEVRRWHDGVIPDVSEAVESPFRFSDDADRASRLLGLVPEVPTPVWGRDEPRTGEMWNSNSLISWLIARSGLEVAAIQPPPAAARPAGAPWPAGWGVSGGAVRCAYRYALGSPRA
jgi:hypothetical protein